jgi:two-component system NtrC family sensor kinase
VAVQDNQQIVCVIRNITNQKKIITDLIASQKLASLGSLAAGIAHEMNSPLQVIIGLSSSLQERLQAGEYNLLDTLQYLQTIHRNGWRGAEIVRSLLQYARPSIEEMSATDLNETVHETLILIENQLKTWDNIRVNLVLEPKLPKILGRKSQLSQALINLLSNARDAMPTGGEVSIRTAFEPSTQKVLLQVADSGDGIPLDKIPRIFDPFFTSKEVGQGTGLGLSIVLGIVNSHQAEIQVDSEPGRGSTFTISFPILTE